jgi:hypothetical protein
MNQHENPYHKGFQTYVLGGSLMMNPFDHKSERGSFMQWQKGFAVSMDEEIYGRSALPCIEVEEIGFLEGVIV